MTYPPLAGLLALLVAVLAAVLVAGCGGAESRARTDDLAGVPSPPPIDLRAPDIVETASFGFG